MWLVRRDRLGAAIGVVVLMPLVHEMALLTVVPIFALVVLSQRPFGRTLLIVTPVTLVNLIVLAIPPSAPGAIPRLMTRLQSATFTPRTGALALFERTQAESWKMYSIKDAVLDLLPLVFLLVGVLVLLWVTDRTIRPGRGRRSALLVLPAACGTIAAPALLVFGGWDSNRWMFLVITNFFIVLWILGENKSSEFAADQIMVLAVTFLILARAPIWYFDKYQPRPMTVRQLGELIRQVGSGSLFAIPKY